jgi:hypothetical protein
VEEAFVDASIVWWFDLEETVPPDLTRVTADWLERQLRSSGDRACR